MVLYDYRCAQCGPFREWKPMSESQAAVNCPSCSSSSSRIMKAPFLADMPNNNRVAHQRNELSAHEPRVMSRPQLDNAGVKRGHSHAGHGHKHDQHNHNHSGRPWMIGH